MAYGAFVGWPGGVGCIIEEVTATVDSTVAAWQDLGIVVQEGERLAVSAYGETHNNINDPAADVYCYPEGAYSATETAPYRHDGYDPDLIPTPFTFGNEAVEGYFATHDVPGGALALKVSSTIPATGIDPSNWAGPPVTGCLYPKRKAYYANPGTGTVWGIWNSNEYPDNSGSYTVILRRLSPIKATIVPSPHNNITHCFATVCYGAGYLPGVSLKSFFGYQPNILSVRCSPRGWVNVNAPDGDTLTLYDPATGTEYPQGADVPSVGIWRMGI